MSDYENAMSAGPVQALRRHVNAFRAGKPEGRASSGGGGGGGAPPQAQRFTSPPLQAVREHVAGMSDAAKAGAARNAEMLTAIAQGMAGKPYAERKAIMAHMAPHLQQALGVGDVATFDPTDTNLAQVVGEATMVRSMLGGATAPGVTAAPAISIGPGGQEAPES